MTAIPPLSAPKSTAPLGPTPARPAASVVPAVRKPEMPATASPIAAKMAESAEAVPSRTRLVRPANAQAAVVPAQAPEHNVAARSTTVRVAPEPEQSVLPVTPLAPAASVPVQARALSQTVVSTQPATGNLSQSITPSRETPLRVGEDDLAIFEEMRAQLIVWLRIESVRAGTEITGQTPPQLLELLRQEDTIDDTRLQVVSTLLNLANQVLKNGQVSVLDYKQALMFHLMHTRHWK